MVYTVISYCCILILPVVINRQLPPSLQADWAFWVPCQLFNFAFVPAPYRVLYVSCITVAWNVFMSYAKHYVRFVFH